MIRIKTEIELKEELGEDWESIIQDLVGFNSIMKCQIGTSFVDPEELIKIINSIDTDKTILIRDYWWPLSCIKIEKNEKYNFNFNAVSKQLD